MRRNHIFIAIVLGLAAIQIVPRIYKSVEAWKDARDKESREYRNEQLEKELKRNLKALIEMERYSELRRREKSGRVLSLDENRELYRLTDDLGVWFVTQGEKLTRRRGLHMFDKDEIDALVGIK